MAMRFARRQSGGLSQRIRWIGWRRACLLAAVLLGLWPASLLAQAPETGNVVISQLRVQVLPEFDDPRVLVLVQGRLNSEETEVPVVVSFRIPRGAQINQMAVIDAATGKTEPQPYEARPDEDNADWTWVTYTLSGAHFFYEFYYSPLSVEQALRSFDFAFLMPYVVQDLQVDVQQPLRATGFTLAPLPLLARVDESSGFTYHHYEWGEVAAETALSIAISYSKVDTTPSVRRDQLSTPQPGVGGAMTGTSSGSNNGLLWGGLFAGALLVGGGWMWMREKKAYTGATPTSRRKPAARPRLQPEPVKRESATAPDAVGGEATGLTFCPHCGARLKAEARFCHVCGKACASSDAGAGDQV